MSLAADHADDGGVPHVCKAFVEHGSCAGTQGDEGLLDILARRNAKSTAKCLAAGLFIALGGSRLPARGAGAPPPCDPQLRDDLAISCRMADAAHVHHCASYSMWDVAAIVAPGLLKCI